MDDSLSPEEQKLIKKGAIGVVVLVFLVITALNTIYTVPSGTVGIITRFTKVNRETQPGIGLKIPYIEGITGMNVQIQKEQVDASAATNDLQNVTATVALNYHLDHTQVTNIYVNLTPLYKDNIISPTLQAAVKSVTSAYSASDLVDKRPEVTQKIEDELVSKLEPRGILVDQFSIVNFAFSPEYASAVEAKVVAQQDAEKAQFNLQQAQVNAQANEVQDASLSDQILEQQAIAKWNGILPTTLAGQGSIFNIPLSK